MSNNIKTNALTGYDLFLQQGNKLKQNNLPNKCNEKAQIVDRITPVIYIEEDGMEKKGRENPPINRRKYLEPIHFKQNLQGRRLINNTRYQTNEGLVLPKEITSLVHNKMYLPRHKKLARDYGVDWLLKLAELARTKGKPGNWYAKATGLVKWEQTEAMLIELFKKIDQMKEKLAGLGVPNSWIPYFVGAKKKLSEATFNRCVELARARGVNDRYNYICKAVKNCLARLPA